MLDDLSLRIRLGIEKEVVGEREDVRVGDDPSLCCQEKGVTPESGLKLLHVVRAHCMQQACAIVTGGANFSAPGKVDPRRMFV